jgi:hypothetical protein
MSKTLRLYGQFPVTIDLGTLSLPFGTSSGTQVEPPFFCKPARYLPHNERICPYQKATPGIFFLISQLEWDFFN